MAHGNFKSSCKNLLPELTGICIDEEKEMCMTQYGGIVAHLGVGVLEVVDEDGGEAAHHPDADVQQEKWDEA